MKTPINLRLAGLYAAFACCALMFGWLAFFGGNDLVNEKLAAEQSPAVSRHAFNGSKKQSVRQHLSHKPKKKRIDVKARLAALYEKYPELKPDYPESDKDFTELFSRLFPEGESEGLREAFASMGAMLTGESTWDAEVARQFLIDHDWRLKALVENADPEHHYKELDLSAKFSYYQLLAVGYGTRLKLGDTEGASTLMTTLDSMTATSVKADALGMVLAVYGQKMIGDYAFQLVGDFPEEMSGVFDGDLGGSFAEVQRGEFTSSMELVYQMVDASGGEGAEVDEEGTLVAVEVFEKVLAEMTLERIQYYQDLELSGEFKSAQEIEAEYEIYVKNLAYDEEEMKVVKVYEDSSYGSIYEKLVDARLFQDARSVALSIAQHAKSSTEEYPFEMPINPKTGEPITWDKERNVLITGLEDNLAEVKIPVLKSE